MLTRKEKRELQALHHRKRQLKQLLKRLIWEPGTELTQEEVALIGDVSRQKVRRIEARAILKLRHRTLHLARTNQP